MIPGAYQECPEKGLVDPVVKRTSAILDGFAARDQGTTSFSQVGFNCHDN